ncbi:hypothetical protein BDV29DRAFT_193336 [Aspergillus leporis]|uniref:Rhodopsin domain-containing protein n=1 Tax=Aspergillus leporis TaxID=41062 RepID=A0A5N5WSE3_9EURO|nr:hypothetical protein BDV29DRAFT_193336 [Aspergillus leporis]
MAFALVVVVLRIWVRILVLRALVLMVAGTVLTFGLSIAAIGDVNQDDYVPMLKAVWATRILYVLGMVFVKTSILWFSFRLNRRRWMRWTVYFIIVFEIAQCFASLFGALFSYTPPSKFWDLEGTELGRCTRPILSRFYEVNGILNIVNDIRTWLLPIPMLWRVQMSQRKEGAAFGVSSLGILSVVAASVRYDFCPILIPRRNTSDYLRLGPISLRFSYAPRVLGTSNMQRYDSGMPANVYSYPNDLQKRAGHRRINETELRSRDAIVTNNQDCDGIMLKTDIHMEVSDGGIDSAYLREILRVLVIV